MVIQQTFTKKVLMVMAIIEVLQLLSSTSSSNHKSLFLVVSAFASSNNIWCFTLPPTPARLQLKQRRDSALIAFTTPTTSNEGNINVRFAVVRRSVLYGSTSDVDNKADKGDTDTTTTTTTTTTPSSSLWSSLADENGNPVQQFMYRFLTAGGGGVEGAGEIGNRGEIIFFAQALPIIGIIMGGLPIVSDIIRTITGPVLLLVGMIVMTITALDMGESLTPWPRPNGEGLIQTRLKGALAVIDFDGCITADEGTSTL